MIVDTSAIVAIVLREDGYEKILLAFEGTGPAGIGAPSVVEAGMVLAARKGPAGRGALGRFVSEARLTVLPFTADHGSVAINAFSRFGKGRHPAALNFGDCLTYAIASVAGQPLLCVGDDFAQTDLEIVRIE